MQVWIVRLWVGSLTELLQLLMKENSNQDNQHKITDSSNSSSTWTQVPRGVFDFEFWAQLWFLRPALDALAPAALDALPAALESSSHHRIFTFPTTSWTQRIFDGGLVGAAQSIMPSRYKLRKLRFAKPRKDEEAEICQAATKSGS